MNSETKVIWSFGLLWLFSVLLSIGVSLGFVYIVLVMIKKIFFS